MCLFNSPTDGLSLAIWPKPGLQLAHHSQSASQGCASTVKEIVAAQAQAIAKW